MPDEPKPAKAPPKSRKARARAARRANAAPDEYEVAQTSCRHKTSRGNNLTHGLFTCGCAFCHLQVGLSIMDWFEGPSTCARLIINRFLPDVTGVRWWTQ